MRSRLEEEEAIPLLMDVVLGRDKRRRRSTIVSLSLLQNQRVVLLEGKGFPPCLS